MTYYIRHKETQQDLIVSNIDIQKNTITVRGENEPTYELRLPDVIEDYEFCYDIW